MASYVVARVCDERHTTRELALKDMKSLARDGWYYTRYEKPPKIMKRTPMVGIGAHGGRGLFLLGHCAGLRWEPLTEDSWPYTHRVAVVWDGAVYGAKYDEVLAGVSKYNRRSWTSAERPDFQMVTSRVLSGEILARVHENPELPWAT